MRPLTMLSLFVLLFNFSLCFTASASLLISPTRVLIEDRDRSAKVILINTSEEVRSYRVEWVQQRALPTGGYKELTEQELETFPIASSMIRMSPKQVRLAPGERQIVKLAVRRPKGLAEGEYRSHLRFKALPPEKEVEAKTATEGSAFNLKLILSYSIPVIVREGKLDYSVNIDDSQVVTSQDKGKTRYDLEVSMSRTGLNSTEGSLRAYWTPNGSNEEVLIGILNSVHFYPELKQAKYKLFWQAPEVEPKSGTLRVAYEGRKEFQGIVFSEKKYTL